MANRKPEEPKKGAPEWQATFSDLMNLLLCFFVLLFAMSSVDADKWEQIVASFSQSFSIFNSGSTAIGEGNLVGAGTSQLSNLSEYYSDMGQSAEESGDNHTGESSGTNVDPNNPDNPNNQGGTVGPNGNPGQNPGDKENTGESSDSGQENSESGQESSAGEDDKEAGQTEVSLDEQISAANAKETEEMFDEISQITEEYNIYGYLDLSTDENGKYVEMTISGSILFDSGSANLREDSKTLLSRVGDILNVYDGHKFEVIGHTDNIPIKSSKYESNDLLSSARAISTARYLVEEKNVDIGNISWTGRGEYDPIASNSTVEGRARNRRVEIRIYNSFNS